MAFWDRLEACLKRLGHVAQRIERSPPERKVGGSIPLVPIHFRFQDKSLFSRAVSHLSSWGGVAAVRPETSLEAPQSALRCIYRFDSILL